MEIGRRGLDYFLAHIYTMRAVEDTESFFASSDTKYHVDHIIPKQIWQDFHEEQVKFTIAII